MLSSQTAVSQALSSHLSAAVSPTAFQEYDVVEEPGLTPKQRLKLQKKQLKQRLGMEWDVGPEDAETGADDYIKDEDLEQSKSKPLATSNSTKGVSVQAAADQ